MLMNIKVLFFAVCSILITSFATMDAIPVGTDEEKAKEQMLQSLKPLYGQKAYY